MKWWQETEGKGKERCRKAKWVYTKGRDEEFRVKRG